MGSAPSSYLFKRDSSVSSFLLSYFIDVARLRKANGFSDVTGSKAGSEARAGNVILRQTCYTKTEDNVFSFIQAIKPKDNLTLTATLSRAFHPSRAEF